MKRELVNILAIMALISGCGSKPAPEISSETTKTEFSSGKIAADSAEEHDITDNAKAFENSEVFDTSDIAASTSSTEIDSSSENTVTLCMVGDILLHTPIEELSMEEDGTYDFSPIFSNMKEDISSFDLAVVNEEVIIGGKELGISGYPTFNAPYEIGDALVDAGFDIVCHATNHVLDKGKQGLINACTFWEENYPDITVLGINETPEDKENIYIIEKNGIKIALLNYTYGTNGISQPSDMPFAVDLLEENKVIADLDYAEEHADFTIVFPHWGTEYRLTPDSSQEKWTKLFEEHGADLVIGTHPHVIEPIEFLDDKMLVYYSLGNFVNWTSGTGEGVTNRMVGGMAEVTITKDENEIAQVSDYGVKALVCHVSNEKGGVTVFPLNEYPDNLADTNAIRAQDSSFSKDKCVNLCNEVWGNLWD
ncbi:CapA family protein [Butyrivibrio sp. VCD2006]|uniref:CapA family protein n=1 Tax=Butyrivibrio sp. VCD2006 TaxID=1280664 RepID=UPI0009DBF664|nr:CapA family protein [Butyrivibrio sp. VCD2006]